MVSGPLSPDRLQVTGPAALPSPVQWPETVFRDGACLLEFGFGHVRLPSASAPSTWGVSETPVAARCILHRYRASDGDSGPSFLQEHPCGCAVGLVRRPKRAAVANHGPLPCTQTHGARVSLWQSTVFGGRTARNTRLLFRGSRVSNCSLALTLTSPRHICSTVSRRAATSSTATQR